MFNLDMVGSRDAGDLVMNTADGTPNLVYRISSQLQVQDIKWITYAISELAAAVTRSFCRGRNTGCSIYSQSV